MFFVSKKKYDQACKENARLWDELVQKRKKTNIAYATLKRVEESKSVSVARSVARAGLKEMNEVK